MIASSIAMDKEISKKIFIKNKILTPKYIKFDYKKNKIDIIKKYRKKIKISCCYKARLMKDQVYMYIFVQKKILIKNLKVLNIYKSNFN